MPDPPKAETMSEQTDQINDHAVHERLSAVIERVRNLLVPDGSDPDKRDRLLAVLAHAQQYLHAGSREMLAPSLLDQVQTPIDNMSAQLDSLEAAPDVSYYDTLTGPLADTLLGQVHFIPPPPQDELTKAAAEEVTALRSLARASVEDWQNEQAVVTEAIEAARADLETAKQEVATHATMFEAQLTTLTTSIEQQDARLAAALTDFDTKASAQLTELEEKFAAAMKERTDEAEAVAAQDQQAAEAARADYQANAQATVDELRELRDKAVELVGTVATTGTAGHFKEVAAAEKKIADFWRWVAVVFAALAVGAAFYAALTAPDDSSLDWQHLGAKAILSVSLAGIAGYAGKQSGGHRSQERAARHTSLQLSSVEAFLVSVDPDQRAEIRGTLARHVFGAPPETKSDGKDDVGLDAPGVVPLVSAAIAAAVSKDRA